MSALQPSPEAPAGAAGYRYGIYGLSVRSDFPLPELPEHEDRGDPDIEIRVGRLPAGKEKDGLNVGPDGALLQIADIASYLIRDGQEIVVDPQPRAAQRNVRLYLLGSAMGVLLLQRGLFPLHANAVEIEGKAIAFMGESGAGKSTLAAWLHDTGHRVIADDVCALRFDAERSQTMVHPGMPRIRLWKDALERTGRESGDYQFTYAGDETYEKFDVPVSAENCIAEELGLSAIYLIAAGEQFGISQIAGVEAVDALFSHTYRGFVVPQLGRNQLHFDSAVRLARSTPIFRLERSREMTDMATDVPRIVDHAKGVIARQSNEPESHLSA